MKVKTKPAKKKIVVALLGLCLAVSSYIVPPANGAPTRAQATATLRSAAGDPRSRAPFADPLFRYCHRDYYYFHPYYYYYPYSYYYYYPYFYYYSPYYYY
jgi:hypothetical protein